MAVSPPAAPLLDDLRVLYEDLHAHPELSFAEHRTAAVTAGRLRDLGYAVTEGVGGTGVVATLANGPGPTVLLRADLDALPVEEDTGLPYASTVTAVDPDGVTVPVAHACGHDLHVAWLVGAASVLAASADRWSGRLLLVGQPAEEVGGGADAMVADGLFDRFGLPVVALGQHVAPAPSGLLMTRGGQLMAASDVLRIVLHGRGAHGSAPERGIDPIVLAASTVMRLQTIVSREVSATDSAVVTVGTLHAGTKGNIIPDRAELTVNVRSFEPAVRVKVLAAIERIVHGEAHAAGADRPPEITAVDSFPSLVNDEDATSVVTDAFTGHFGPERLVPGRRVTGSEDFGAFGTAGGFPSVFWFVGGTDPAEWQRAYEAGTVDRDIPYNHSPRYAPVADHRTLATGVEALVVAARQWLTS